MKYNLKDEQTQPALLNGVIPRRFLPHRRRVASLLLFVVSPFSTLSSSSLFPPLSSCPSCLSSHPSSFSSHLSSPCLSRTSASSSSRASALSSSRASAFSHFRLLVVLRFRLLALPPSRRLASVHLPPHLFPPIVSCCRCAIASSRGIVCSAAFGKGGGWSVGWNERSQRRATINAWLVFRDSPPRIPTSWVSPLVFPLPPILHQAVVIVRPFAGVGSSGRQVIVTAMMWAVDAVWGFISLGVGWGLGEKVKNGLRRVS